MDIKNIKVADLIPYQRNAKKHDQKQIDNVAESIRQFGMVQPIVVDKDNNIIIGHCRTLACQKLGVEEVPVVKLEDLTPEQANKLRLLDNKLNESEWDIELLAEDVPELDWSGFDIDWELPEMEEKDFEAKMKEFQELMDNNELSEDDEEYQEFLAKFEEKKTTDDCYTPDNIYRVIADWVAEEYNLNKDNFVRPFRPNGDYQKENYKKTDIVVDNPPFSILSQIIRWYNEKDIKFFLFAPNTSLAGAQGVTHICANGSIRYENGANVLTNFVTNLDTCRIRTAPKLATVIKSENDKNIKAESREIPKYEYPPYIITASMMNMLSKYGIDFRISKEDCQMIRVLDSQKEHNKTIFGGGYIISEKAKIEAEKNKPKYVWKLSEKEKNIIKKLGDKNNG